MSGKRENDYQKVCLYCENASIIKDEEYVLCKFKGVVSEDFSCRKYAYDPLKRRPMPRPNVPALSEDDLI